MFDYLPNIRVELQASQRPPDSIPGSHVHAIERPVRLLRAASTDALSFLTRTNASPYVFGTVQDLFRIRELAPKLRPAFTRSSFNLVRPRHGHRQQLRLMRVPRAMSARLHEAGFASDVPLEVES